ncbi:MAG: glycoside hydrolase family 78 protein [Clostridiales bacterium]|nr:glycoside hydrolase family 78 protein [Clostridiales bacterium]
MLKITRILMDYEAGQVGITHVPQFGWILESDKRNVTQEAWRLEISLDADFKAPLYDSGRVEGDDSSRVQLQGVELASHRKYFVRAKAWAKGEETPWAQTSFVTGILDAGQWKGCFVTVEEEKDRDNSKGTCLRSPLTLRAGVCEAYLSVTALGLYNFYLNGEKVGTDELTPGWTSYRKHLCFQTYEVTDLLHAGENVMGAILAAGWFKGRMGFDGLAKNRNHYGKNTALLAQLTVRYEDGGEEIFATDESWTGTDAPVVFAEIYDGEIYDGRKEIPGWSRDSSPAGEWKPVRRVEYDFSVLSGQGSGRTGLHDRVEAKKIFCTPQGDTVIDFGQNMSALITVTASGKAGDVIQLDCFEVLDAQGNVYVDNLRGVKQSMKYIFGRDGEITWHPSFTFMGFRYAKVVSFPGEPEPGNFTAYAIHTNMEPTGTFESSDRDLNQLAHNILWGLKSNFVDVPTDCPQRDERLGWTGDAQIFCRTACFLMNTYSFYRKWLEDVAADQTPEGGVPHVVPDIVTGNVEDNWLLKHGTHSAAAWADVAVIGPWSLYLTFGDEVILRQQYDSMKKWIDYMRDRAVDYIWNVGLQFGDWVALDAEEGSYFGATPNDLTCTAYFAYSTGLFARIAGILGKEEDAREYGALQERIVDKFRKTFFDADGEMTAQTQTAHILALYFDLVPEEYREKTANGLIRLLEKENGHLVTGFVGTPYFCHALSENGHVKEAWELLLKDDFPSWLYQVKMGATTVWEHWDGLKPDGTMWSADMNSFNHYAYGAIGEWMFRVAAGLEVDEKEPGYKHSVIYPRPGGGLAYVKAGYRSVYGRVESFWEDQGEEVTLHVSVPVNTHATICLDGAKAVKESDGLTFAPAKGCMAAEAGSGDYTFVYVK